MKHGKASTIKSKRKRTGHFENVRRAWKKRLTLPKVSFKNCMMIFDAQNAAQICCTCTTGVGVSSGVWRLQV
jgi:hypothetical protein